MDLNIEKKLQTEYYEKPQPKKTFNKKVGVKQQSKGMRDLIDFLEEGKEEDSNDLDDHGNRQKQNTLQKGEIAQDEMQKKVKKD